MAAYDVFGSTGGGLAGTSNDTGRRTSGLAHDESFFLLLNGETIEEISRMWDTLSDGATVIAPLVANPATASPYGMLTDHFGATRIFGVTPAD